MTFTLQVQKYLSNHSLNNLIRDHGVYHRVMGHKMSLNYDQIEAKDNDPISQECRGLVLCFDYLVVDPNVSFGQTEILAYGLKRFFNYGQDSAANINFNKAYFAEKLDGTCIIFYYDSHINKWCVATRSLPEANLNIDGFAEHTFTSLFIKAVEDTSKLSYNDWLKYANLDKNITYVFELCTPYNRIVVKYDTNLVYLICMRNKITGIEYDIYNTLNIPSGIPLCPNYNISNTNDMIKFVESTNPLEHEGLVVCDDLYRRVKVKNPAYVAYNRIRDSLANSPRALMQLILQEKLDDLSTFLPENIMNLGKKYQENLRNILQKFQEQYDECMVELNSLGVMSDKVRQKQFALIVQRKQLWLAPMMVIFNNKAKNLHDYFNQQKNIDGEYKKSLLDFLILRCEHDNRN